MPFRLLMLLWVVITVWSFPADASAMAHCQKHRPALHSASVLTLEHTEYQSNQSVKGSGSLSLELSISTLLMTEPAVFSTQQQHHTKNAHHHNTAAKDCCDTEGERQSCSGNCLNCHGCATVHHVVLPTLDVTKATFSQPKIHYTYDSYLSLQSPVQDRPPKS